MNIFRDSLKPAGISLSVIVFLNLIGLPLKFGSAAIWIFFALIAAFGFAFTREDHENTKWWVTLSKGFFIGLFPAVALFLLTYFFASLQAQGVRVTTVMAQILPEHTAALTGLTREDVLAGVSVIPGLIRLVLELTLAGLIGAAVNLLPYSQAMSTFEGGNKRTSGIFSYVLPFLFFGGYLALRLPSVKLFGSQENIFGLVLLYGFFGSALFSLRAINSQRGKLFFSIAVILVTLWVPLMNDLFQNAVLGIVTIFIIMGFGLNIVVGFAGMLDLGYVAFFAVGAYSYALLSAPQSWVLVNVPGFEGISFWAGLPIAILLGMMTGVLLGIPVLRLRGDYLAIVTLGFGEIIRLIVLNLRDYTGGPGGILDIPAPYLFGHSLGNPRDILYLAMAMAALAAFIAVRLKESRVGRAWVALREDETVAQAMGINLVATKLMAFAFGAVFAALSGILYASRQVNIFPDNFALDVSINVLSLIIIGGIGSLEGVVMGAIALIGLPEILRSVNEYRIVAFGALLVIMMILRPEGILPSQQRSRELHAEKQSPAVDAGTAPK